MGKTLTLSPNVKSSPQKSKLTRRFKCDLCEFTSHYKSSLKTHAKVHVDESPLACPVLGCSYTTKWKNCLKNHKTTHEDETTVWYECDKCDFKTKYKYVLEKRHTKLIHSEGPIQRRYYCDICEYGCDSRTDFFEHRKNHNKDVKRLTCDFPGCVYTARWKANMFQHKKLWHSSEVSWLKCDQCNYKTQEKHRLRRHLVTHTEEKSYKCPYPACDFAGRSMQTVRSHQERLEHFVTSDGEICEKRRTKKYKCRNSGCKFSTNELSKLNNHIKIHDPKRKRDFKCPLCDKSFFDANAVKMHVRYHTGEKSVACAFPNCKFKTLYPSELKKHDVRIHTGTTARFTCRFPECEASFKVSSYLRSHERLTHAVVKPFSCTFPGCEAKFKCSGNLKKHMNCHDPEGRPKYPCNLCSAEFLSRPGLYSHIIWHTNEKAYKCANCEYSTSRAFLLKSHKCVGSDNNGVTNVRRITRSSVKRVVHDSELIV